VGATNLVDLCSIGRIKRQALDTWLLPSTVALLHERFTSRGFVHLLSLRLSTLGLTHKTMDFMLPRNLQPTISAKRFPRVLPIASGSVPDAIKLGQLFDIDEDHAARPSPLLSPRR
jgi:hypothetical protein